MLTTTVILCAVFGIAMIESPMQSVDDFSFYLILIVGFALVADFLVSPAIVMLSEPWLQRAVSARLGESQLNPMSKQSRNFESSA